MGQLGNKHHHKKGVFVVSLDCELLWGSHYVGRINRFPYLRKGFVDHYDKLLGLFDKYKITATFAFVGAISLSHGEFKLTVDQVGDSKYRDWLDGLVNASDSKITDWYNQKIIKKVLTASQKHEIGSHSFTHLRFNDIICDDSAARYELEFSQIALSRFTKRHINTLVFPENRIAHLAVFKESSYKIYRSNGHTWYRNLPMKRILHFLDQCLPIASIPVELQLDSYCNHCLPSSLLMFPFDGIRKVIPDWLRYKKIKRGIDRAIIEKKIFHLWFHPWNLGSSSRMIRLLERILAYVDKRREEGVLAVSTIGELLPDTNCRIKQ